MDNSLFFASQLSESSGGYSIRQLFFHKGWGGGGGTSLRWTHPWEIKGDQMGEREK